MAVTVRGSKVVLKSLKRLSSPEAKRAVEAALFAAADMHATEAALSITRGSVSGKNHFPSRGGQPPNADTHLLDRSIHAERAGPLKAKSVADAPYALALEKGTSRMIERPFMRPAAIRTKDKAVRLVAAAISRVAKDK